MSNEKAKAIRVLSAFRKEWDTNSTTPNAQALDIAIKVLQQQPCEDCISRQEAIDAVKHAWAKGFEPSQYIENLSSVTPQPKQESCEDYISRNAVRIALVEKGQHSKRYRLGEIWELNLTEIDEVLNDLPSVYPARIKEKWIDILDKKTNIIERHHYECSNCGYHGWDEYNYCPRCGVEMER